MTPCGLPVTISESVSEVHMSADVKDNFFLSVIGSAESAPLPLSFTTLGFGTSQPSYLTRHAAACLSRQCHTLMQ